MKTKLIASLVASMAFAVSAQARPAQMNLKDVARGLAGPPTQVMVLGTSHLSGFPKEFKAEQLAPLLDRLAVFHPEIITIESLSGEDCDRLKRFADTYPGVWNDYCWDTDVARKATGLDVPAALAETAKVLAAWPATPAPADRRHLAALFSAANDRSSALVQWLRLPESERHSGDGLDDALVAALTERVGKMNENYQIAAVLAARLGLERVYPVDDHSADSIQANLGPDFEKAMEAHWRRDSPERTLLKKRWGEPGAGRDMLEYYRTLNDPENQWLAINTDFGDSLRDTSKEQWGRRYVAWWETRNLRMVSNIRAAFGRTPGARVLTVVGSSHKPYFDAYLGMMHDVKIVDTLRFLR